MTPFPTLRRWVLAASVAAVFGAVCVVLALQKPAGDAPKAAADAAKDEAHSWPLFGGTLKRNLVNLFEKNMPTDLELKADGTERTSSLVAAARLQGLRRPDHLRRQDLHRHQQQHAAQPRRARATRAS